MSSGIVVCRILFSAYQKLWVKERTVFTGANLVNWGGIEINEDTSWDIFASASLREKGLEGAAIDICGFGVDCTIW